MKKSILLIVLLSMALLYSFNVNGAYGDFRTKTSGNWNVTSTWEWDNGSWVNATWIPTYTDADITIQTGHSVIITTSVTVDQVNVKGTLTLNAGVTLTINNGTGTDVYIDNTSSNFAFLYVYGTIINQGTLSKSDGTIYYYDNSIYSHPQNGGSIEKCHLVDEFYM